RSSLHVPCRGENTRSKCPFKFDHNTSSQAFMEYLKKSPRLQHVPRDIPQDKEALFLQRLEYYRQLYRPTCDQTEPESER
ncbi:hypothetical protein, partial [Klebsiella pneumoniae]|uniref:hypothetical protein n=1 Tax=Klebsiella pneumoniae TaxID=573 RepID=UPI0037C0C60E